MKAIILSLLLIALSALSVLSAQTISSDDWNRDRLLKEQKAMKILAIWGSVNVTTGVVGSIHYNDKELKIFSLSNAGFGAVNTILGITGIRQTKEHLNTLPSLEQGYEDLRKTRNILLVNAGLDVGYIITGLILRETYSFQASFNDPPALGQRGLGSSLIVQGGALLLFDSITAWQLSKSQIHISPVLTPNGAGLGFQTNFAKEKPVGVAWF